MRRRSYIRIALSMLALACLPAECDQAGAMMRLHGYTALKPPNMLMLPGTLVTVTSHHPFSAAIVCGPWASLGPEWKPQRSPTPDISMRKVNGKSFTLEAEIMNELRADARFKSVQSITGTLSNGVILELRDEDVAANMVNRSEKCKYVIQRRLRDGFPITMISSSLVGNVEYRISYSSDANLDIKTKLDISTALSAELAISAQSVTETSIKATNMVWGIRDDEWLASLSIPELDENAVSRGTRHIQPETDAEILPIPEAPVVTPIDRTQSSTQALDVVLERRFKRSPVPDASNMRMYQKLRAARSKNASARGDVVYEDRSDGSHSPARSSEIRRSDDLPYQLDDSPF